MVRKLMERWRRIVQQWRDYPLREGAVIAKRYRVERFMGMGSYGLAYAAVDAERGDRVLVKVSKPSKGETSRTLLRRESDIMQALDHPQIPRWLNYIEERRRSVLAMELIEGVNLEARMMEEGEVYGERAAARTVRELLAPLGHLHERGFVHRDVRIPNVLECRRAGMDAPMIYLIDFGLACRIGERLPEALRLALGEEGDPAGSGGEWGDVKRRMRRPEPDSDLYGAGHFALFMLYSGYAPQEGADEGDWRSELALSAPMREWIERSLGGDRPFRDALECAAALDVVIESLSPETADLGQAPRPDS
ncbi:serine/threonine protein kinase [Paenibacillus methanolicus]|uniref:Serine/threonine-protein kinase n=1 Tax=Paenibacillus methanolicus TaxID=582686 RepID=A0A5S5BYI5_9BACL|nr:protein kinase [Paenibacillus methanolicus]TYP70713.1 serine/threonine-protein kinase [Paenibacillus methanolicus]